jgi:adenylylsulfate kinase
MAFKIILIMGLPGSGKSTLASKLVSLIGATALNADEVRRRSNDWDFTLEGRKRQADRMRNLSESIIKKNSHVVADFVCPTPETRKSFKADIVIWLDTIKKGRYEDTNKMFVSPRKFDFRVTEKNAEKWAKIISNKIKEIL